MCDHPKSYVDPEKLATFHFKCRTNALARFNNNPKFGDSHFGEKYKKKLNEVSVLLFRILWLCFRNRFHMSNTTNLDTKIINSDNFFFVLVFRTSIDSIARVVVTTRKIKN